MENNEKHIVDNIRNHREEIDLDSLWADVSSEIPVEKRRRRFGFWIFGGMVLMLFVFYLSWIANDFTKVNNSFATKGKQSLQPAIEQKLDNISSYNTKNNLESTHENNVENEDNQIETKQLINDVDLEENFKRSENQNKIDRNNFKSSTSTVVEGKKTEAPYYNQAKDITLQNLNAKTFLGSTKRIKGEGETIKNDVPESNLETNSPIQLSGLTPLESNIEPLNFERGNISPEFEIDIQKHIGLRPQINRWSIYLIGGVGISDRILSTNSAELQSEINRREDIVNVQGVWGVEVGVGFRVTPKLRLLTGLNYSQIHEKETFETNYLVDFEVETENLIYTQDGAVTNETSSSLGQGNRNSKEVRFNQLRMLQIPLKLSYEVMRLDNWKFNMGISTAFNIRQEYTGFTSFSEAEEVYNLSLDKDNKFKINGSMTFGVFLEGVTHISSVIDLAFGLGYTQTKNITTEIYLIDQQYNSFSITSGFYRRF